MSNQRPDQMSDEQLRREVKEKRADVAADVDALADKLDPKNLRHDAKEAVLDAKDRAVFNAKARVRSRTERMAMGVRDNPLPYALIAGGVGWLLVDRYVSQAYTPRLDEARRRARNAANRATGAAIHAGERAKSRLHGSDEVEQTDFGFAETGGRRARASQRVNELRGRADARFGDLRARADAGYHDAKHRASLRLQDARIAAEHARDRGTLMARDAGARAQGFYEDNPLAVGGIALALGIGLGLVLPTTRREVDLVGERSSELRSRARDLGRELKDDVTDIARTTAKETAESAKETVRREAHSHHLDDPKAKLGLKGDRMKGADETATGMSTGTPGVRTEGATAKPGAAMGTTPSGLSDAAPTSGNGGPTSSKSW